MSHHRKSAFLILFENVATGITWFCNYSVADMAGQIFYSHKPLNTLQLFSQTTNRAWVRFGCNVLIVSFHFCFETSCMVESWMHTFDPFVGIQVLMEVSKQPRYTFCEQLNRFINTHELIARVFSYVVLIKTFLKAKNRKVSSTQWIQYKPNSSSWMCSDGIKICFA